MMVPYLFYETVYSPMYRKKGSDISIALLFRLKLVRINLIISLGELLDAAHYEFSPRQKNPPSDANVDEGKARGGLSVRNNSDTRGSICA